MSNRQGHYRLSIKPTPRPKSGLEIMEDYGRAVLIIAVVWGGFFCMRFI